MSKSALWILLAVLLLAAGLRLDGVGRDTRLHGDEALFASFARLMVLQGDWNLYEVPTDKPPTTFALVGSSLLLLGEHEFAVRLPNAFVSLIGVAVVFQIGRHLVGSNSGGMVAALLLALSPLN